MGFVNKMNQNVAEYKFGFQMKKLRSYPFVWKLDIVLQYVCVLHRINKDEGDQSMPLLAFEREVVIFPKYSKEGTLSSIEVGIRNIPSDVCCDDTKRYQMQSGEKQQGRCKVRKKNSRRRYIKYKSTWCFEIFQYY